MGLATLLRGLAQDKGIELDPDELDALGLSDEESEQEETEHHGEPLGELQGTASGMVELFLAADSTTVAEPVETKDELMWYPIMREGQWAVRPGPQGQKRRRPLKVVAGKSKNQRKEIGLQDIVDAHEDEAVQHVTVPLSHANTLVENQGFIDKVKIVDGKWKHKATKKVVEGKVLMGGYRITEPDTKGKMQRGTYANRSAGLLYDYVNTETGKSYPVVLEHCALTNKPWLTGMISFGRKLVGMPDGKLDMVSLSLSDEGPDEDEYVVMLADELDLEDDARDFLALAQSESDDWSKEGSPNWLRQQVNTLLDQARAKKLQARRSNGGSEIAMSGDYPPYYRCAEAKPGKALISDGYGDDANFWAAPITVKDGAVELGEFDKWTALKKAYVPDDRPAPPANALPLAEQQESGEQKSRLQLAQEARKSRATGRGQANNDNTRGVVKQDMAATETGVKLSDLSPEAQKLIADAEARAQAAEKERDNFAEKLERVTGTVQSNEVEKYIDHLRKPADQGGLGLSEERGFGGVLAEVRELLLADDGEPALQGDHFAVDGNTTGELSFTDGVKRIFSALVKVQEGKASVGEQLSQPADEPANGGTGAGTAATGDGKEGEALSETAPGTGKPGTGEASGEKLSTDERKSKILEQSPSLAALTGANHKPKGGVA